MSRLTWILSSQSSSNFCQMFCLPTSLRNNTFSKILCCWKIISIWVFLKGPFRKCYKLNSFLNGGSPSLHKGKSSLWFLVFTRSPKYEELFHFKVHSAIFFKWKDCHGSYAVIIISELQCVPKCDLRNNRDYRIMQYCFIPPELKEQQTGHG